MRGGGPNDSELLGGEYASIGAISENWSGMGRHSSNGCKGGGEGDRGQFSSELKLSRSSVKQDKTRTICYKHSRIFQFSHA